MLTVARTYYSRVSPEARQTRTKNLDVVSSRPYYKALTALRFSIQLDVFRAVLAKSHNPEQNGATSMTFLCSSTIQVCQACLLSCGFFPEIICANGIAMQITREMNLPDEYPVASSLLPGFRSSRTL